MVPLTPASAARAAAAPNGNPSTIPATVKHAASKNTNPATCPALPPSARKSPNSARRRISAA